MASDWDIEFAARQRAAYEKAKVELRWLVEQEQLRAGKVTPVIQTEASSAEVEKAKAPRRKNPARKFALAKQIINDKYPNGTHLLSIKELCKSVCNSLPKGTTISDTTILEAAGRKRRK